MNEHNEIIKILIENKVAAVNINVADWDGCTALIHAAKKGSVNVLKTLLDLNADIYAKDVRDMTALHHAAFSSNSMTYFRPSSVYPRVVELRQRQ